MTVFQSFGIFERDVHCPFGRQMARIRAGETNKSPVAKVAFTTIKTKTMKKSIMMLGLVSMVAVSCSDAGKEQTATAPVAPKETAPAVPKEEVSVTLKSNDQMKFDLNEIRVPSNSVVTLTLVNEGELPKAAMGHNFVLLAKGTDVADYAMRAIQVGIDKDHVVAGRETIAYTKLLGGGESVTITFDAPADGEYAFICSFPGHYGMMKGKFIVG